MKNIALVIQYDGSGYSGWQIQENALGIQQVITEAIQKLTAEKINLIGSGRTDSGVHAYHQVANFRSETKIRPDKFHHWINVELPEDIRVVDSYEVDYNFHARFDAISKTYVYRIMNCDYLHPIFRNQYELITYPLDIDAMKEASRLLVGEHDFTGFAAVLEEGTNPIRTIDEINITKTRDLIEIELKAMSFLRNQVRIIAGTMVEIGRGRKTIRDVEEVLKTGKRAMAGPTLGGRGLYLMHVRY